MFKRVALFLATNLAIMLTLSVAISLLGLNNWLTSQGINYTTLMAFCAVFGFGGAFISLLISKPVAKWSVGAKVITGFEGAEQAWIVQTVEELAQKAGIAMPEVALYEGEPNAFATGATKNKSLVAVSTGLLNSMNKQQVRAVLAHEIAHIANSDMVSLTLIQGVVNTFVMFAARVVGYAVDSFLRKDDEASSGPGIGYTITVVVLDMLFGVLAMIIVSWFSRKREFRADSGAAELMGDSRPMISALQALEQNQSASSLPKQVAAFGIAGGIGSLFATHPPISERIKALQER